MQQRHFFTVDTIVLFFALLTTLASVKLIRTERPVLWAVIAALGYGFGLATKASAAPLALPILIALCLLYADSSTVLVFVIAIPYALLDWVEFSQQVSYQGDLARGLIDLPYVRQFVGSHFRQKLLSSTALPYMV